MSLESYWLFVGASVLLCIVPGPDMIYLLGRSIAQGRKAGLAAAVGINLGGYFHLFAAIVGISAIIATSSIAFTILKWCGAVYLFYVGLQALLSKESKFKVNESASEPIPVNNIFWQGFLSDVLNPKVAIFFISLLPQFVNTEAGNVHTQLIILGFTVNIIALVINIFIVQFAHSATLRLRRSNKLSLILNKLMGTIFIGLGVKLANEQQ